MVLISVEGDQAKLNAVLYQALTGGEDAKVLEICESIPKGPLHILTIHNDTVLHIATVHKRNHLVLELLNRLPETYYHKLTWQNSSGYTLLHEAATSNGTVPAAAEMLRKAPTLLSMSNRHGETALFVAARSGKTEIFKFLDGQVNKTFQSTEDLKNFLLRNDKSTILHKSIHSENFYLAHEIAIKYKSLVGLEDGDGMTALQLLACNSSAFDSGVTNSFFKRLIYSLVNADVQNLNYRVPLLKNIGKQKHRCESAKKLANFLIENDISWEETESMMDEKRVKFHRYRKTSTDSKDQITDQEKQILNKFRAPATPLFLATKSGCTEIVKGILEVYPQAVEHIDEDGRNILHVAIRYRRNQIFEALIKMNHPLRRLRTKTDKFGNSILHLVGLKAEDPSSEAVRSPALILREELLMYERVKEISSTIATLQINSEGKTAEKLFAENNAQLRMDAKEWMKRTAENCSIVAVLIATVAFAAAYTVPGGPDQQTGYPLLRKQHLFLMFTMADALSLTLALTSVIIFLSILTSPFQLEDFKHSLPQKLLLGLTVLIFSVAMMMVAFAATVILMIRSEEEWTKIALYLVAFFPVTIFVFSYFKLYKLLMKNFKQSLMKKIRTVIPPRKVESSKAAIQYSNPSPYPTTGSTNSTTNSLV